MARPASQISTESLGIRLIQVNNQVMIRDVTKGSTAEKVGLCAEATILVVNHHAIDTLSQVDYALQSMAPGQPIVLITKAKGALTFFNIK